MPRTARGTQVGLLNRRGGGSGAAAGGRAAPRLPTTSSSSPVRRLRHMESREHDVPTADGRVLRVLEAGDLAGPAIVVHHGTPGGRALYRPWIEDATARGLRLVAFDRPGYGGSSPPPAPARADVAEDGAAIAGAGGAGRVAPRGAPGGGPPPPPGAGT